MAFADDRGIFSNVVKTKKRIERVWQYVVTTTNGTIGSDLDEKDCGMSIALTASEAGRYTCTVWKGYKGIRAWGAGVLGPDDAAMTTAKGIIPVLRDVDIGGGANDGTVELQWCSNVDLADADVQDSAAFWVWFDLETF